MIFETMSCHTQIFLIRPSQNIEQPSPTQKPMKPPAVAVRKNSSGGSKLNFDRLKSNFDGGKPASGGGQLQRKKSNPFDDDDDDEQENDQTIDIDQDPFEGKHF